MTKRLLALAGVLSIGVLGCGGGDDGTYLIVDLRQGAAAAPRTVDIDLTFNGQMASRTLDDGMVLVLPKTAVFKIRNGEGSITVVARAKDVGGVVYSTGSNTGSITQGSTTTVVVTLGVVSGPDGGMGEAMLAIDKTTHDFGTVETGQQSAVATFALSNTGLTASGIPSVTIGGANAAVFTIASNGCTAALDPAGTCQIGVRFDPSASTTGAQAGELVVMATPGGTVRATLAGMGVAPGDIRISPTPQDFGSITVNTTSSTATFTIMNAGGVTTGVLATSMTGGDANQFNLVSDGCMGQTLGGGASCTINVRFAPTSAGNKSASLTVAGTPGGTATSGLTGVGLTQGALTIAPSPHDFGSILTGMQTTPASFTVTNTGQTPTSALAAATLSGANAADFAITTDGCMGMVLAAGGTCNVSARFSPVTPNPSKMASLVVSATTGGSAAATLTGNAIAPATLAISPMTQNYGTIIAGNTATQTFTVSNSGGQPTTVPTAVLSNATDFSITTNNCTAALAPAGNCTIVVRFAPATTGSKMGMLTVSATTGGSAVATLSGMAIPPGEVRIVPSTGDFMNVLVGQTSTPQTFMVSNMGGVATAALTVSFTGADMGHFMLTADTCSGMPLGAGASCSVSAAFRPTSRGGKSANLLVMGTAVQQATASLSGTGQAPAQLGAAPGTGLFGSVVTGSSSTVTFTISNTGDVPTTVPSAAISGTNGSEFSIATNGCTAAIPAGMSCMITVRMSPTTTGAKTATLTVTATTGGNATATLSGAGVTPAALSMTPTSNDFMTVSVGSSSAVVVFTVMNTGGATSPTIATSKTGTDPAAFVISSDTCNGQTLAGMSSCTIRVAFTPLTFNTKSATLTVTAGALTDSSTMTGTGQDTVTLTVNKGASTGTGTIAGSMITCGTGCTTTSTNYTRTTANPTVTLTATAAASSTFSSWSGGGCNAANPCTVTLSAANTTVTGIFAIRTYTIDLRKIYRGTATGIVTSSPVGINCTSACTTASMTVNYGTSVTLTATPTSSLMGLEGWTGSCTGSTCTMSSITANQVPTATFAPYNMAFVTSVAVNPGSLGSIGGADAFCQSFAPGGTRATGTLLPAGTNYKALVLPSGVSSVARVTTGGVVPRGWIRTDGRPFLDQIDESEDRVRYPLRIAANGTDIGSMEGSPLTTIRAATNSDYYGNAQSSDCAGFTATTGSMGAGEPAMGSGNWLSYLSVPCQATPAVARLYCVGVDYRVPLVYAPAVGRIAFLSQAAWGPGMTIGGYTGLASADEVCRMEATNAGLPNPIGFLAAMSTTTTSASARFNFGMPAWVRTDGVALSGTASAFFDTATLLMAPLNVTASGGVYQSYWTWTGSGTPQTVGTSDDTCGNWLLMTTGPSVPRHGVSGKTDVNRWNESSAGFGNPTCTFPVGHIFCLQQ